MSSSKVKNKVKAIKVSRKKVSEIAPKVEVVAKAEAKAEVRKTSVILSTLQAAIHSSKKKVMDIVSHASYRFEKWILLVLLALSTAAFLGVKLFESSNMSFTLTETPSVAVASNTLSSEAEFKAAFKENRKEARAIVEKHAHKTHKIMSASSKSKKADLAKNASSKKSSKKAVKNLRKVSSKKAIAQR
jgi:hypothetical protein